MGRILAVARGDGYVLPKRHAEFLNAVEQVSSNLGRSSIRLLVGVSEATALEVGNRSGGTVEFIDDSRLAEFDCARLADAIAAVVGRVNPDVVLFPDGPWDNEIAGRLAAETRAPLVAGCVEVGAAPAAIRAVRTLYGRFCVTYELTGSPTFLTLRSEALPIPAQAPTPGTAGRVERVPLECSREIRHAVVGDIGSQDADSDLATARVVVAGGRGIQGPEGFSVLRELAELLGGSVGASRAAVDAGWVPASLQIGQTGKAVAPILYLAVGISGASQHIAGIAASSKIVALNKDQKAPIMSNGADVAVVGDWRDVVPALLVELRRRRAQRASGTAATAS